jgi:hypothetical protein
VQCRFSCGKNSVESYAPVYTDRRTALTSGEPEQERAAREHEVESFVEPIVE